MKEGGPTAATFVCHAAVDTVILAINYVMGCDDSDELLFSCFPKPPAYTHSDGEGMSLSSPGCP